MSMFFETYRGTIHWMSQMSCCRWIEITFHCMSMFFETYRGTIHWMSQMSFCRNLTFKACNTDPYVSLPLLHAVVRWKGLVNRVPCVPRGCARNKIRWRACWDFALLVVLGFWLTGAKPDYPFIMGIPVHGRVRRRRNVWWFGVVYRKKEVTTWETHRGITRWQHSFRKMQRIYNPGNLHGNTGWQFSFQKMSDYEITQGTGSQLVERYKKNEIVTGFENVWYIRERIHNIWVIR